MEPTLADELQADQLVYVCLGCRRRTESRDDQRGAKCADCGGPLQLDRVNYRGGWVTPEFLVGVVPAVGAGVLREHGVSDPERVIQRATELELAG